MNRCTRKNSVCKKLIEFLKEISIGQYPTKLYYNGKGFKGSTSTGFLTIVFAFFLTFYAYFIFSSIFQRKYYYLDMASYEIATL